MKGCAQDSRGSTKLTEQMHRPSLSLHPGLCILTWFEVGETDFHIPILAALISLGRGKNGHIASNGQGKIPTPLPPLGSRAATRPPHLSLVLS